MSIKLALYFHTENAIRLIGVGLAKKVFGIHFCMKKAKDLQGFTLRKIDNRVIGKSW